MLTKERFDELMIAHGYTHPVFLDLAWVTRPVDQIAKTNHTDEYVVDEFVARIKGGEVQQQYDTFFAGPNPMIPLPSSSLDEWPEEIS